MTYIYAIGDIHGRDYLLEKMYLRIQDDPYRPDKSERPIVVHIGDYIDGGPNSSKVLDIVMKGSPNFDSISLLGNHEALMLDCLNTDNRDVWWNWISNGGDKTLESLGISNRFGGYNPKDLSDALGEKRIKWLQNLPLYHISAPYLFVHAGIVPNRPLAKQKKKDMLWIRSRFLESSVTHPYVIVHGHTQTELPELLPNRIGIDTGAARPKTLTAVVLDNSRKPRFISVSQ
jgi:serine/threonine protein phosphatase 1